MCEAEAERSESELSMIRYIAWAIPSVGFIGTVRGIGDALAQAHKAVGGDITGVTSSLGVAFNSTFIALLISLVLMFLVHQIQLMQERLVHGVEKYCQLSWPELSGQFIPQFIKTAAQPQNLILKNGLHLVGQGFKQVDHELIVWGGIGYQA